MNRPAGNAVRLVQLPKDWNILVFFVHPANTVEGRFVRLVQL